MDFSVYQRPNSATSRQISFSVNNYLYTKRKTSRVVIRYKLPHFIFFYFLLFLLNVFGVPFYFLCNFEYVFILILFSVSFSFNLVNVSNHRAGE